MVWKVVLFNPNNTGDSHAAPADHRLYVNSESKSDDIFLWDLFQVQVYDLSEYYE